MSSEGIPKRWLAVSAFVVCSSVESLGVEEEDLLVLLIAKP